MEQHPPLNETLRVGRNANLTLGTDALIVLDESFLKRDGSNCCGLLPGHDKNTRAIPYFNILWAEVGEFDLTIQHAYTTSKDVVRPAFINYLIEKPDQPNVAAWVTKLLARAYGSSQRQKRIKILVNPFGGKGSAEKWYHRDIEPIFAAARCVVDVERTQYQGHAVEIAERLDVKAFDVLASCSGDGLPHEVFNGLGRRPDARSALAQVAVVQLPCGSGNAMSWNLNGTGSPSLAALCVVKGLRTSLDLVSITQGDRRTLSFLSQAVGIVAEIDLGTDNLRWMGSARFTYGFLVRLMGKTVYPCDIAVKVEIADKAAIKAHYRNEASKALDDARSDVAGDEATGLPRLKHGSVLDELPDDWVMLPHDTLGNFYAGNMAYMSADTNFFPAALPNDGCLDLVRIAGDISRLTSIQCLTGVDNGTFFDMDCVSYNKVAAYRIIPKGRTDGYISIDGERVPFEPFQAEVHRGLGTVLSKSGHIYAAPGVDHRQ